MTDILNRTFELTKVSSPELSYFREAFGEAFNIKFLPNHVVQLSSIGRQNNQMFLNAKWHYKVEGEVEYLVLDFGGSPIYFSFKSFSSDNFELRLAENRYFFSEKST
jgi:hypothetical protein